jgi:hypothetical protein
LQGFVVVDEVTIGGNAQLHVLNALMSQLLVVILKYFTGLFLPVEEVLHVDFGGPQLLDTSLKLCNQQSKAVQTTTSHFKWLLDKTTRTVILVAERLVLLHKFVALRLHLLDFVVVLGEGAVQL